METIIDAKNAAYNENGTITADVLFNNSFRSDDVTPEYLPFTAAEHDSMDYGRQLFADLKAGKYGKVKPFTVTPEMVAFAKQDKLTEVNAWRDSQENGSITFTLNNHKWDCSKTSQARLAPVVAVARTGALPPGFFWTDADNIDVVMTADELIALEVAMQQNMVLQGFRIHERQRQMKDDIDKLTDYKAIQDYIIGWTKGNE
ncbi:DUF4376 domain-containing protein [Salmonella enterica subsp. enterica serovar Infantis]|nr:DUF4376 domain-containing protein [Salmonella enterica subsp. enterica serovar Infantis]